MQTHRGAPAVQTAEEERAGPGEQQGGRSVTGQGRVGGAPRPSRRRGPGGDKALDGPAAKQTQGGWTLARTVPPPPTTPQGALQISQARGAAGVQCWDGECSCSLGVTRGLPCASVLPETLITLWGGRRAAQGAPKIKSQFSGVVTRVQFKLN